MARYVAGYARRSSCVVSLAGYMRAMRVLGFTNEKVTRAVRCCRKAAAISVLAVGSWKTITTNVRNARIQTVRVMRMTIPQLGLVQTVFAGIV